MANRKDEYAWYLWAARLRGEFDNGWYKEQPWARYFRVVGWEKPPDPPTDEEITQSESIESAMNYLRSASPDCYTACCVYYGADPDSSTDRKERIEASGISKRDLYRLKKHAEILVEGFIEGRKLRAEGLRTHFQP